MLLGIRTPPPLRCACRECCPFISRWRRASGGIIGTLGEVADACALCWRVDEFRRKNDALRSTATSARGDATAKEGHVNYDVSDVPVVARAARTMGSG